MNIDSKVSLRPLATPIGWGAKLLLRYAMGKSQFDHFYTGLFEGSILHRELHVPRDGTLRFEENKGAPWVAFDYNRQGHFGREEPVLYRGYISVIVPTSVSGNDPEELTDLGTSALWDPNQFHDAVDRPPIEQILEWEFMRDTVYSEAYERLGLDGDWQDLLREHGLADQRLYQITPKGNGLVHIRRERGKRKRVRDYRGVKVPA